LFAGLIALTVQGIVLYYLVELAERLSIPRQTAAAVVGLA
jgi:ABC-type nitrate/sulfonate/bicarbonate transport system permease component